MLSASLRDLARRAGYAVSDSTITIAFKNGRKQLVHIDESDAEVARLWSVILPPKKTETHTEGDPLAYAWKRNRFSDLVGFTVDNQERLIGETWMPLSELTLDELKVYVQELARVCDLHEVRLIGADEY